MCLKYVQNAKTYQNRSIFTFKHLKIQKKIIRKTK